MAAMFSVRWLVTASSRADGHAARADPKETFGELRYGDLRQRRGSERAHAMRWPRTYDREDAVGDGPCPGLLAAREIRLDQHRIGEQAKHRARIRNREVAVGHGAACSSVSTRIAAAGWWRRAETRAIRLLPRADRECAITDLPIRLISSAEGKNRQPEQTHREQGEMNDSLGDRAASIEPMRVGVAGQQRQLEEQQTGGPYGRRSAEPWQNHFRDQRLDFEEKKCAEENGGSEGTHRHRTYFPLRFTSGVNTIFRNSTAP